MCGRFTMTRRDKSEMAALIKVPESELGDYTPRFNIAPTQPYFVLKTTYERREAVPATWGLVNSWATDTSQVSLRVSKWAAHAIESCHVYQRTEIYVPFCLLLPVAPCIGYCFDYCVDPRVLHYRFNVRSQASPPIGILVGGSRKIDLHSRAY
jgi:SOS response associated peptidase (SRAP)